MRVAGCEFSKTLSGFTFVELLVVCTILSITGVVAYPLVRDSLCRAEFAALQINVREIGQRYAVYCYEHQQYPEDMQSCGMDTLVLEGYGGVDAIRDPDDALLFFRCTFAMETSREFFRDPFMRTRKTVSNLLAFEKSHLASLFPFPGSEKPGAILVSLGPDRKKECYSVVFPPQVVQYDATNGISSIGDIFLSIPEMKQLKFKSTPK